MKVLPDLICLACGAPIPGLSIDGGVAAPSRYEDCLRKCAECGQGGHSNSAIRPTWIFKDPLQGVPIEVRSGLSEALDTSLNVRSRNSKRFRFGFETSEDALTWTVFRFLLDSRLLASRLSHLIGRQFQSEPTLLLWGSPIPGSSSPGLSVRSQLVGILRGLSEDPSSHSEPDVVVDFGTEGVVLIEAKYRSRNDRKVETYSGWDRGYLDSVAFTKPQVVRQSGLYELARNWRIAWDLAGPSRPAILINLGTKTLLAEGDLDEFASSVSDAHESRFIALTWSDLLGELDVRPEWLRSWLFSRSIM
jgi:hypothetical protein